MLSLLLLPLFTALNTYFVFGAHPEVEYSIGSLQLGLNLGIAFNYTSLQMIFLAIFAVMASLTMGVALLSKRELPGFIWLCLC